MLLETVLYGTQKRGKCFEGKSCLVGVTESNRQCQQHPPTAKQWGSSEHPQTHPVPSMALQPGQATGSPIWELGEMTWEVDLGHN